MQTSDIEWLDSLNFLVTSSIFSKLIRSCAPMGEQTDSIVSSYVGTNNKQLSVIVYLAMKRIR